MLKGNKPPFKMEKLEIRFYDDKQEFCDSGVSSIFLTSKFKF